MRSMTPPSLATLARNAFLEGAPESALSAVQKAARWAEADPGTLVIDFEDSSTDVFLVMTGTLRALIRTADGRRTQILSDFSAGETVGELAAIDGTPRSARVEALVVSRLCILPAASFLDLLCSAPAVNRRVLRSLTERLRNQTARLMEQAAMPVGMRLTAELLRLSRARPDGILVVSPPPTQEELASRIGARRETVARELSQLRREGWVRKSRAAYVLCEPEKLRASVQF